MTEPPHPPLRRAELADDPIDQFRRWYGEWCAEPRHNPEAVVVSTADRDGRPSARYVLLRGVDVRDEHVIEVTSERTRRRVLRATTSRQQGGRGKHANREQIAKCTHK